MMRFYEHICTLGSFGSAASLQYGQDSTGYFLMVSLTTKSATACSEGLGSKTGSLCSLGGGGGGGENGGRRKEK